MFRPFTVSFEFELGTREITMALAWDEHEVVLFDGGYPGFLPRIQGAAIEEGLPLERLTKVFITHHDFDHIGALGEIKRQYPGVQIFSEKREKPFIEGEEKSLRLRQAEALFPSLSEKEKPGALAFQAQLERVEKVRVDGTLADGDRLSIGGGIRVIGTPGHMPGHLSYYMEEEKTLVAGDAMVVENGALLIANPHYTLDMKEAKNSIRKLLTWDIQRVVCYHGGTFEGDVQTAMRKMLED